MDDVCKVKYQRVDERLFDVENQTDDNTKRISVLEQYKSSSEVQITNLCDQIKSLVSTIKWSMGLMLTSLLGFVIWYIQQPK